jgi:hypothetical protein
MFVALTCVKRQARAAGLAKAGIDAANSLDCDF